MPLSHRLLYKRHVHTIHTKYISSKRSSNRTNEQVNCNHSNRLFAKCHTRYYSSPSPSVFVCPLAMPSLAVDRPTSSRPRTLSNAPPKWNENVDASVRWSLTQIWSLPSPTIVQGEKRVIFCLQSYNFLTFPFRKHWGHSRLSRTDGLSGWRGIASRQYDSCPWEISARYE